MWTICWKLGTDQYGLHNTSFTSIMLREAKDFELKIISITKLWSGTKNQNGLIVSMSIGWNRKNKGKLTQMWSCRIFTDGKDFSFREEKP